MLLLFSLEIQIERRRNYDEIVTFSRDREQYDNNTRVINDKCRMRNEVSHERRHKKRRA